MVCSLSHAHTLFKHLKFHHATFFVRGVRSGLKNTHASQWSKKRLCFRDTVEVHVLSVWTEKQNFESLTVQFVAVFVVCKSLVRWFVLQNILRRVQQG